MEGSREPFPQDRNKPERKPEPFPPEATTEGTVHTVNGYRLTPVNRSRRRPRESPLAYKHWSIESYISFHVYRTYTIIACIKNKAYGLVRLSKRIINTKLKKLGYTHTTGGAREFFARYRDAIVEYNKWWYVVDCSKFVELEARVMKHIMKHNDIRIYIEKINEVLRKVFSE